MLIWCDWRNQYCMIRLECIDVRLILGCSTNYADANFRDKLAYRKLRFGCDYLSRGLFSLTPRLASAFCQKWLHDVGSVSLCWPRLVAYIPFYLYYFGLPWFAIDCANGRMWKILKCDVDLDSTCVTSICWLGSGGRRIACITDELVNADYFLLEEKEDLLFASHIVCFPWMSMRTNGTKMTWIWYYRKYLNTTDQVSLQKAWSCILDNWKCDIYSVNLPSRWHIVKNDFMRLLSFCY